MKLLTTCLIGVFVLFLGSMPLAAQTYSEVGGKTCLGVWKTYDDETGEARSHVKIWESNGKYYGKIIKLLNRSADEDQNPTCDLCPGDRKGRRVIGLTIIKSMKKEDHRYAQGKILDPEKGKEYTCTMWLTEKNTLKVRGWWGMFYRTQTWRRVE